MYYEMLNRVPREFNSKDVFGNLVKMQHFGIPTRLLDVTKNALVALYFSVAGSSSEDGRVYGFGMDFDQVCFPQDLPSICNWFPDYKAKRGLLELWGREWWDEFMTLLVGEILQFLKANIDQIGDVGISLLRKMEKNYKKYSCWDLIAFEKFTKKVVDHFWHLDIHVSFQLRNKLTEFMERHCCLTSILTDSSFQLWWHEMTAPIFVHSPMNNQRVISQQGGFILFPPNPYSLRENYFNENRGFSCLSVRVSGGSKSEIRKELEYLGISEPELFPEIDRVSDYVKRKYSV